MVNVTPDAYEKGRKTKSSRREKQVFRRIERTGGEMGRRK
jgi:hypothetical protein